MKIESQNIYEEKRKEFEQSRTAKKAAEFFAILPYAEKYKNRNLTALIASYVFNIVSISSAATLVYLFMLELTTKSLGVYAHFVASPVTIVALVLIEVIKRDIAKDFFKDLVQLKKFNIRAFVLILAVGTGSAFISYDGGKMLVKETATGIQYVDADTLKDVILLREQITALRTDMEKLENQKNSQGQTLYKVIPSIASKDLAITNLETEIANISKEYRETNKKADKTHNKDTARKSENFAVVTVICELAYLFCIWYTIKYLFNSVAEFAETEESEDLTVEDLAELVEPVIQKKSQDLDESKPSKQTDLKESKVVGLDKHPSNLINTQTSKAQNLVNNKGTYLELVNRLSQSSKLDNDTIQNIAIKVSNFDLFQLKKNTRNFYKSSTEEGRIKFELAKWQLKNVGFEVRVIDSNSIKYDQTAIA